MKIFTQIAVYVSLFLVGMGTVSTESYGQSDNLVRNRLKRIALGDADDVRKELPDLLADFPSDPGVKLLHAILVDDASRALPLFEAIVQDYPQSEWADDAQWRIVQIYAIRKDTARAWQELKEYRKAYPDSEFLLFASELVKNAVGGSSPVKKTEVYKSKVPPATTAATPKTQTPATATPKTQTPATTTPKTAQPVQTPVTPQEAERDDHTSTSTPEKKGAAVYSLQVGVYSTSQGAEAEVEKFRQARMRTEVLEKMVGNEKKYAVIIGSYSSREAAEKAKETVEKYCNCTPFIIER